jgi:uncharacterized protein
MPPENKRPSSNERPDITETAQPTTPRGLWAWCRRLVYESFLEPLIVSGHPPWFDARGVCVGLVVGFAVPVGGHTAAVALLRLLFRFNFVVAIAFTWVCNPFNVFFLYYGYYVLGSVLLNKPVSMDFDVFQNLLHPIADKAYFWQTLAEFGQLGQEMLSRWCVAAVLLGVVFGVLGYVATYRIQKKRCMRAADKLRIRYDRYLEELEKKLSGVQG